MTVVPSLEEFVQKGKRIRAHRYLNETFVAFASDSTFTSTHHAVKDVFRVVEEEIYAHRPEYGYMFSFIKQVLMVYPLRMPPPEQEAVHVSDKYAQQVSGAMDTMVGAVLEARPTFPFDWLMPWLDMAAEREYADATAPPPTIDEVLKDIPVWDMNPTQLSEFVLSIFMEHDTDSSGGLDRKEFKAVLNSTKLGFSSKEVKAIMAESDENDDGIIDYKEFLPLMVDLIGGMKARHVAAQEREQEEQDAREAVQALFVHGMHREELEAVLGSVFTAADKDGNGFLDRKEFSKCLKSAKLGLTKKEINLLLSEVDYNDDGAVSYYEFLPLCFELLVERAKDKMMESKALNSSDAVTQLILDEFYAADTSGEGQLKTAEVKRILTKLSDELLSLSKVQILSLMSESRPDKAGMVSYAAFAPVAAKIIYGMIDYEAQKDRLTAVTKLSSTAGAEMLKGLTREQVEATMMAAFKQADADNSGTLDRTEMYSVLQMVGTNDLGLDQRQIAALVAAADEDGDGHVDYQELTTLMFETLMQLGREDHVRDVAFTSADAEIK